MKSFLAFAIILFSLQSVSLGQGFTPYSQQHLSRALYNPAGAGIQDQINAAIFVRREWTAFPGMPTSNLLIADMPINHDRMALGLRVGQQSILASSNWEAHMLYAYKINVNRGRLSFGVNVGLMQYSFNTSELRVKDEDDRLLNPISTGVKPDLGFGMMYTKKNFYVGISTLGILGQKSNGFNVKYTESRVNNSFLVVASNKWLLSDAWNLETGLFLDYELTRPVFYSTNFIFGFKKQIFAGTNIRSNKSAALILGFNLKAISPTMENMTLGYSYDLNFSVLNKYLRNTHEITLNFKFGKPKTVRGARQRPGEISPYDL